MRRALEHPYAPVAVAALVAIAYLIAAPQTADMAAQAYRTGLWEREGFTVWNAQWYGGHHVPGYSLLFPPLAGAVGARAVGALAGVAAAALFVPLARAHAPSAGAARAAGWLFAGGAITNVIVGRMPFTLGLALGVGAWACAERGGRGEAAAAPLSLACVWASPVAGIFLAMAAVSRVRERVRFAVVLAGPAVAGGLLLAAAFPEGGSERFVSTAFWPMLAVCAAGLALLDPARRGLRAGAALYLLALVLAFALPTPLGQNALRLGVTVGAALLVLAPRPGAPRVAIALVAAALVYLQWLPAVRAVEEARGDPSTHASFHTEALRFLQPRIRPGERVEVPFTHNHWEAAYLAPRVPLARGWERQLDRKVNPLFYEDGPLDPVAYARWLRDSGVRFVALPDAPLDFSAEDEASLLEKGAPFLRIVYRSPRWRIWQVIGAPLGRLTAARVDGFELRAPRAGRIVVRQRYTPYWTVTAGAACVERAAGDWTAVHARAPGRIAIRARFSLRAAVRRQPGCE